MTTAADICTRALRIVGEIGIDVTPDATEQDAALTEMNALMHGLNGPPHFSNVDWSTASLATDIQFEAAVESELVFAVANRLPPKFGVTPTDPDTLRRMRQAENNLAQYFRPYDPSGSEYI